MFGKSVFCFIFVPTKKQTNFLKQNIMLLLTPITKKVNDIILDEQIGKYNQEIKGIKYVTDVLKGNLEKWERKEYESVLKSSNEKIEEMRKHFLYCEEVFNITIF